MVSAAKMKAGEIMMEAIKAKRTTLKWKTVSQEKREEDSGPALTGTEIYQPK